MSTVKNQHYVPRWYLRRFANPSEQLFVYDKATDRSFRTSIENVAAERGFYDMPELSEAGLDRQFVEQEHLQAFETEGAQTVASLLKSIDSGTFHHLRGKRRRHLARLLVIQAFRTREQREHLLELACLIHELHFRAYLERTHPEVANARFSLIPEAGNDIGRALQISELLDPELLELLTGVLLEHLWFVVRAEPGNSLWTSDHPVMRHGHIKSQLRSYSGFASRGIEIAYPISPSYALVLAEREVFGLMAQRAGTLVEGNPDHVMFYNSGQVIYSRRYLYAAEDDFALARDMCQKSPELRDSDRNRVGVRGGPWSNLGRDR